MVRVMFSFLLTQSWWVQELDLREEDKLSIENGNFLNDRHTHAVQKLLQKQFPDLDGLQSTCSISAAVQIHFTGAGHWVTSQLIGREVRLYDSLAADTLTSSIDEQLARIYKPFVANGGLLVSRMPVQQLNDEFACGLFSIAFAYHAAAGNNVKRLNFDQDKMRWHLVSCLSDQKFTSFPQQETAKKIVKCSLKHIFIPLFCTYLLPEAYDRHIASITSPSKPEIYPLILTISSRQTRTR